MQCRTATADSNSSYAAWSSAVRVSAICRRRRHPAANDLFGHLEPVPICSCVEQQPEASSIYRTSLQSATKADGFLFFWIQTRVVVLVVVEVVKLNSRCLLAWQAALYPSPARPLTPYVIIYLLVSLSCLFRPGTDLLHLSLFGLSSFAICVFFGRYRRRRTVRLFVPRCCHRRRRRRRRMGLPVHCVIQGRPVRNYLEILVVVLWLKLEYFGRKILVQEFATNILLQFPTTFNVYCKNGRPSTNSMDTVAGRTNMTQFAGQETPPKNGISGTLHVVLLYGPRRRRQEQWQWQSMVSIGIMDRAIELGQQ